MKHINYLLAVGVVVILTGCSAKTVQDVGTGIQIGAASGTPLAPVALAFGIATQMVGKLMESDPSETIEAEDCDAKKRQISETIVILKFRALLQPTPEKTSEQINAVAEAICVDVDRAIADKGGITANYEDIKSEMKECMSRDGENYFLSLAKNPLAGHCFDSLVERGGRMVAYEKLKRARQGD